MHPAADDNMRPRPVPSCPFRRVLVAFDGSADSIIALRTATALVGANTGHVVALAVLDSAPHREAERDGPAGYSDNGRRVEAAFEAASAAIGQGNPARVDLHTIHSRQVAGSLCEYASEHGFDLLVIGRHGGGLIHQRLGHVAEVAARTCKIPVLLVGSG